MKNLQVFYYTFKKSVVISVQLAAARGWAIPNHPALERLAHLMKGCQARQKMDFATARYEFALVDSSLATWADYPGVVFHVSGYSDASGRNTNTDFWVDLRYVTPWPSNYLEKPVRVSTGVEGRLFTYQKTAEIVRSDDGQMLGKTFFLSTSVMSNSQYKW